MAYTIQILSGGEDKRTNVFRYLQSRMEKEGVFRAKLVPFYDNKGNPCIKIKPVRLVKAKPYCGNHPGPCELTGRKKPNATYLEWDDWVKFHNLVNRVLNRFRCNANVFSTPHDVKGKMWVRKGLKPRIKYDWTEENITIYGGFTRAVRVWNQGTLDQFEV